MDLAALHVPFTYDGPSTIGSSDLLSLTHEVRFPCARGTLPGGMYVRNGVTTGAELLSEELTFAAAVRGGSVTFVQLAGLTLTRCSFGPPMRSAPSIPAAGPEAFAFICEPEKGTTRVVSSQEAGRNRRWRCSCPGH